MVVTLFNSRKWCGRQKRNKKRTEEKRIGADAATRSVLRTTRQRYTNNVFLASKCERPRRQGANLNSVDRRPALKEVEHKSNLRVGFFFSLSLSCVFYGICCAREEGEEGGRMQRRKREGNIVWKRRTRLSKASLCTANKSAWTGAEHHHCLCCA